MRTECLGLPQPVRKTYLPTERWQALGGVGSESRRAQVAFHALRKIFTTEFLRVGGTPKQELYWLRHATSKLVMNVYAGMEEALDMASAVLDIGKLTGVRHTTVAITIHERNEEEHETETQAENTGKRVPQDA